GFLHGIDRVLMAGAVAAQSDYGDGFQQEMLNGANFTPEEEVQHLKRISALANGMQLNYIGALVRRDGKFFYTVTSSPDYEFEDGTYDRFWTEYDDVAPELLATFADGKVRYAEHED